MIFVTFTLRFSILQYFPMIFLSFNRDNITCTVGWTVTESSPYYRQMESESHQLKNLYSLWKVHTVSLMALRVKTYATYTALLTCERFFFLQWPWGFFISLLHTVRKIIIADKLKWHFLSTWYGIPQCCERKNSSRKLSMYFLFHSICG